jgi:bla regulator protein BlaR1
LLVFRILFSVFQITWYYLTLKKQKKQGFTIIYLKKRSIPFSFFNLIFIGKQDIEENTQIIEHEKIHAKQIHTIDLLIAELLVAAMWFNPFIWMYKRELQQVHEFLADEGVLNSGVDQLEYQTLLVNHAAEGRLVAVSSNFSYSLIIKKRIKMMSKKENTWQSRSKTSFGSTSIVSIDIRCILCKWARKWQQFGCGSFSHKNECSLYWYRQSLSLLA